MCQWGNNKLVFVKIPADLSSTGRSKWKYVQIDSCIADLVEAIQQGGIDMRGSCCGHGKGLGDIHLQDGRILMILSKHDAELLFTSRFLFHAKYLYKSLKYEVRWLPRYIRQLLNRGAG